MGMDQIEQHIAVSNSAPETVDAKTGAAMEHELSDTVFAMLQPLIQEDSIAVSAWQVSPPMLLGRSVV